MILIGVGSNLPDAAGRSPAALCRGAVDRLDAAGVMVRRRSPWYESAPVPRSDQPWYVNGVVAVETGLGPADLLSRLQAVEAEFGRVRGLPGAARVLDLDLIAHGCRVSSIDPILPHPRMDRRAFVLLPLRDVAPGWRHPVSGRTVEELLAELPPEQEIRLLPEG